MINENDTARVLKAFFSNIANNLKIPHCVKSVQIQSYFSVFGLNTGKYGPEQTLYLDTFYAVPEYITVNMILFQNLSANRF